MRLIFAGTPSPALPTFETLLASDHDIVGVITRTPAKGGRGRKLQPSPVAARAQEALADGAQFDLIETDSLRSDEVRAHISSLQADLGVIVAYGALVPAPVLEIPTHGWVNLHFSDLPRWRGAAPVQWAIREGDQHTASCVFQLEAGLDTGPVFSREAFSIDPTSTAGELLDFLAQAGAAQVLDVVNQIASGTATATPQVEQGLTHARMLTHADGFVDFSAPARQVNQIIRSVTPNPGAWTLLPDGRRMKLGAAVVTETPSPGVGRVIVSKNAVDVGCADVCLRLGKVAPAGKGWMDGAAWARGARPGEDFCLGGANEDGDTGNASAREGAEAVAGEGAAK
ncbi:MAG: methionyl-tRNA formyltransferase [Actinomycetaceae bacterium]|nr:methionyl-tRNA formyltransferase [Actinomycetaceae bacterium]